MRNSTIEDGVLPEGFERFVDRANEERSAYMRACLIGLAHHIDKSARILWSLSAKASARVRQPMSGGRTWKYRSYKGAER